MPHPQRRLPEARAMIVAPQPEAVEAGAEMLKAGGNAIDAMIACALTQGVVDPLMCSIGGVGCLQLFDPASGTKLVLDGLSTCPTACHEDMWGDIFEHECADGFGYVVRNHVNEIGHRAVTTPGFCACLKQPTLALGARPGPTCSRRQLNSPTKDFWCALTSPPCLVSKRRCMAA
jgi:gamma-glutamyltranspeptidase/glutathione hydrolase